VGTAVTAVLATAMCLLLAPLTVGSAATSDRDGDGLRDAFESRWGITDRADWDSDDDGVIDAAEDSDGDRLGNLGEQHFGTRPDRRDSDRDGRPDGQEDADGDGRSNAREQDQRALPAGLRPTLQHARRDLAAYKARCGVAPGGSRVNRCIFGDRDSRTVVALMGDSHAQQLTLAARRAAAVEGWKLVTIIKGACPPLVGVLVPGQAEIDGGRSCETWRRGALRWLRAHPPTLVVIAHSDSYAPLDDGGRALPLSGRVLAWRRGLSRTLAAMPARSDVLVLGDTPHNADDPVSCLSRHRRDMSACVSRRVGPRGRIVERNLREVTHLRGQTHGTLYGKVCSYDPCPLVQGEVLIYRDRTHLTATFSRRLWPAMRTLLENTLRESR
jgi:hypothetical protein